MINQAVPGDEQQIAALATELWPAHTVQELTEEYTDMLSSDKAAVFIAFNHSKPVGFAQCQLRQDYVEGTSSSPVGYLEGIFVQEDYRRRGIASRLLQKCEQWANEKNCSEFASDCELDNQDSLNFHLNHGFQETNRIICFAKKL